jgi:hypothetical protein
MPSLAEKMKDDNGDDDDDDRPVPTTVNQTAVNQGLGVGASIAIAGGALLVVGATVYARRRLLLQKSLQDLAPLDADTGEIWLEETPSRTAAAF